MTTRIGIVGAGNILGQYLDTFAAIEGVEVAAISAAHPERARAVAAEHGLVACTTDELLAEPSVQLVVNLTPPALHTQLNRAVVAAGKHLYSEKPLGLDVDAGRDLLAAAAASGVAVGCAPDTFLGTGLQSTAHALRSGRIGEPFAAIAMWGAAGPEPWHPNPQIFYSAGGGPVLDMGPYYITALVAHLGPVVAVTARSLASSRARVVGSGPRQGTPISVEVPTYATAILEHAGGALSTVILSFETHGGLGLLEISGTAGRLRLPDPNWFSGHGAILTANAAQEWTELADSAGFVGAGRGVGAADLLQGARQGRPPRASGALALHVTEILVAITDARPGDGPVRLTTTAAQPEPVDLGGLPDC